jgi:hypothetical protein
MKEAVDLLIDLKRTLDEAAQLLEDMPEFDTKPVIMADIDSAYNDISYRLSELS